MNQTTANFTFDSPINENFDQCDYKSLFSHLPASIEFYQQNFFTGSAFVLAAGSEQQQFQQRSNHRLAYACICILIGLFYSLCGYRFLKLSTFIVGFSLGSSIIYLILSEQKQLSFLENLVISLSIGVLFAFVALLVQYIGLFLIGITSSIAIATCILILIDLFYTNKSAWLCIGVLFLSATILASFTLKFQKSLTIVNTSCIGAALLLVALDFFVENNILIEYIYELYKLDGNTSINRIYEKAANNKQSKNDYTTTTTTTSTTIVTTSTVLDLLSKLASSGENREAAASNSSSALALFMRLYSSAHEKLCWFTWLVFGAFFLLLIVSLLVQFLITGRSYDHRDTWQKLIKGSRKKRTANLEKIRLKSSLSDTENHHQSHHHHHHHFSSTHSCSSSTSDLANIPNDTLLLAESGRHTHSSTIQPLNYTSTSTIENNPNINNNNNNNQKNRIKRPNVNANAGGSSSSKNNNEIVDDADINFEIISFEVIKPTKSNSNNLNNNNKSRPKSKPKDKQQNSVNISTTASTSSTGSSSSTCQLIPIKLNANISNNNNGNLSSKQGNPSVLIPPPVPTVPPPKLPTPIANNNNNNNTSTNNSTATTTTTTMTSTNQCGNSSILSANGIPNPNNLSKIKHHRPSSNSSSKEKEPSNDKFRYFYQIRRNNGDVLSQDFMNNLQTKISSSSNLQTNLNETLGSGNNTASSSHLRSSSLTTGDKKRVAKKSTK